MGVGTGTGRGGRRENQTGRPVKVPSGEGEKTKVTVAVGAELLELLRAQYPGLSDQDTLRAGLWAAVGRPVPHA
ncbi:hypothetical protein [Deinococcus hopiensis]|uniref:Uncharacterized protein n=1 Tax=Deinococcus hopiensis KR-140 TaxID=695939 RepID=A0A1W1UWK8_9DEIO|nr:hypothetical protein [Deinococcus hopiensis]SMB85416.1 hypothetical protein SAMN00790413_03393 [Deinococcus hopiensis KR-140]